MKFVYKVFYLALLLFAPFPDKSFGSHIIGGELTYKWLRGTTYVFTLTLYRDCAGIPAPNSALINLVSGSCSIESTTTLLQVPGTGVEITPSCPGAKTTCDNGLLPGFQKWQYSDTTDIGMRCIDWTFSYSLCCRNASITTISSPATTSAYIYSTLDNLDDSIASSPVFTDNPKIVLCAGQPVTLSNGATDYDADSLVSSLITPMQNSTLDVRYISPYSAINPIASDPPARIDAASGDIYVTPTLIQVGLTTVLVKKYHQGMIVGTVIRDIEFITTVCSGDTLPTASGINGGTSFDTTICPGSSIAFDVFSNDSAMGDTIAMSWSNSVPNATFTTSDSAHPVGTFSWTSTAYDARYQPYWFQVTVSNSKCPFNGFQNYTYSIYVSPVRAKFIIDADTRRLHHYIISDSSYYTETASFDWNWGDGSPHDTVPYPSHTYDSAGYYNICLTLTNPDGCASTFCDSSFNIMRTTNTMIYVDVVAALVTGLEGTNSTPSQINFYPNPAFNQLTIHSLLNKNEHSIISVFNMVGEEVLPPASFYMRGQDIDINISKLSPGIYYFQLKSESGNVSGKFVKE